MDKLRRVLSGNDYVAEEESGIIHQISDMSTFSWSTRFMGFCICFIIGFLLSLLGSLTLFLHLGIKSFAILYTLGNITSMASTCFLMGPLKQFKNMFAAKRLVATIMVFFSIIMTLLCAILLRKAGLTLVFIIIQSLAMTWYSLSYIPGARTMVSNCLNV